MKLAILIGAILFVLMFAGSFIFPGGRISQALQIMEKKGLPRWVPLVLISLVALVIAGYPLFFAPEESNSTSNAVALVDESAQTDRQDVTIVCPYAVTTFQVRYDTIQIGNLEPEVVMDRYMAPPQLVQLKGREANEKPWAGNFVQLVKPYDEYSRLVDVVGWNRVGPCRKIRDETVPLPK